MGVALFAAYQGDHLLDDLVYINHSRCGAPFLNSRRIWLMISAARAASFTTLDAASRASSISGVITVEPAQAGVGIG